MESNPLLAALQSNYGDGSPPPPDPTTVRGLLAFCKMWLDGEVETADLNNPCMEMSGRLKAGAKNTEASLRQNPDMVEEASAPVERVAEAYWAIADVLDRLPALAAENDVEGYEETIDVFEHERQVVLDCVAEIDRNMSGEFRLCPRCASQGEEDVCPACGVTRLYPDPKATEYDASKTAVLLPLYGQVYQAYDSVMSGEEPLSELFDSVALLEQRLVELRGAYQQVVDQEQGEEEDPQEFQDGQDLAQRILTQIDRMFEGINRIRSVEENYRMADLSRGWDAIFDAAVDIQRATQRFAKTYGHLDETDSIDFSGA